MTGYVRGFPEACDRRFSCGHLKRLRNSSSSKVCHNFFLPGQLFLIFIPSCSSTPLEIFVEILTRTLPRSMQDPLSRIMEESGLKMGQDLSQMYVWPMQDLDMVEPWYTQDADIMKLWCNKILTRSVCKIFTRLKQILAWLCMYVYNA